jgi:hypothetical protein
VFCAYDIWTHGIVLYVYNTTGILQYKCRRCKRHVQFRTGTRTGFWPPYTPKIYLHEKLISSNILPKRYFVLQLQMNNHGSKIKIGVQCIRSRRSNFTNIITVARSMSDQTVDDVVTKLSSINLSSKDSCHQTSAPRKCSVEFKHELEAIQPQFTIFKPISDCGYYGWNVSERMNQPLLLSSIQSTTEITRHININQTPKTLLPLKELKVPCSFDMSLEPDKHRNTYPCGQFDVASLYVASKHRNVSLNDIDFMFGGSTLALLANADAKNASLYMVCRIPTTTNTIMVRKCKEYAQNLSDIGFQFERYVTTGMMINSNTTIPSESPTSTDGNVVEFVEHMHIMEVGHSTNYNVLFCADADAMDAEGNPIEIKSSRPRNWGTNVMFQMISSGSPTLCCAVKNRDNQLKEIQIRPLSDIASHALQFRSAPTLERRILNGMNAIQTQMTNATYDDVYQISFDQNGNLKLRPADTSNALLLPPTNIVAELLK